MTDVHMKEAIERLRKEARDALNVYSDPCLKYGGEPAFPQWAKDALETGAVQEQ